METSKYDSYPPVDMTGKRVLLLYARFFGYDKMVKEALERRGAIVDLYDARANINVVEKAIKKVSPVFYFKKQARFHKEIQESNSEKHYDYIYTNEFIAADTLIGYKRCFPEAKLILYLDDSVANLKGVDETFPLYDRVLTFDRMDAVKYSIELRPLFFGKAYQDKARQEQPLRHNLCFIGTIHSDRQQIINLIEDDETVNTGGRDFYRYCYLQSGFMYWYYFARQPEFRQKKRDYFAYSQLSAEAVAENMAQSVAILDIEHPKQSGLTMRTIETLGMGKKLVTTNADIANYDFYNSNNILIIDRNDPKLNAAFFDLPYEPLSKELYEKYSIDGWIDCVFADGSK